MQTNGCWSHWKFTTCSSPCELSETCICYSYVGHHPRAVKDSDAHHCARQYRLSMHNTGWEQCLPVHTFNLTALKIAIIMDIFTEVKIHDHDKLWLTNIFSEFARHEGVNRGVNPEWIYNSQMFQTGTHHPTDEKTLRFFLNWSAQKKRNLSPYLSCLVSQIHSHICPLSHCNSHTEFNGMHRIRVFFTSYFFFCSQCFLCWCLHSVIFFLLINLFDMITAINYLHICLFIYLIEGWMV